MIEFYFTLKSVGYIIGCILMAAAVIWAMADHFKKK